MKYPFRLSLVFTIVIFCSALRAQSLIPGITPSAYRAAIEDELTKYGGSRYLYEHADAYERLIQYRALKRMGYDLALATTEIPDIPEMPEDSPGFTTVTKDIYKNSGDQDETTIAISRTNKQVIVAGANDLPGMINNGMPAYTSINGGESWSMTRVPRVVSPTPGINYVTLGDPSIASGDSGYFYYAYLTGLNDGSNLDNLVVASSKDGKKWINGGLVIPEADVSGFEDKENIWVDNSHSSPHYGRIYLAWVHFNDLSGQQGGAGMIAWSDNRGKTWSSPVNVIDAIVKFSEIRTGKHGEVFLSLSIEDSPESGQHYFFVSTDGGSSFTQNTISDYLLFPKNQNYRPSLKGFQGFRAYPYIAHDVDLISNRIHLVYGTWIDDGVGAQEAGLFYVSSSDLGKTWTKPLALGISNPAFNSPGFDRFCPWVSVDQKTGITHCFYYSSERDPDNLLISAYRAKLTPDLKDFPTSLEAADFDPTLITKTNAIPFLGDYTGSDSWDSVYAAAWTEVRTSISNDGDVFVFIEKPYNPGGNIGVPMVIRSVNLWLAQPSPNPSVSATTIRVSYYLPRDAASEIALYSSSGVKVKTFAQEKMGSFTYTTLYSLVGISSGTYTLRLSTPYGSVEKNLVIIN